jgi:protein-tyrosine phosphatase
MARPWPGVRATADTVTEQMALDVLAARGVRAAPHPALQLTTGMLDGSDLVLTADRSHRASVLLLRPSVLRRTFTLLEFARLVETPDTKAERPECGRAQAIVRTAAERRALKPPLSPDHDNIADPHGSSPREFHRCGEAIAAALEELLPVLFPSPRWPPGSVAADGTDVGPELHS